MYLSIFISEARCITDDICLCPYIVCYCPSLKFDNRYGILHHLLYFSGIAFRWTFGSTANIKFDLILCPTARLKLIFCTLYANIPSPHSYCTRRIQFQTNSLDPCQVCGHISFNLLSHFFVLYNYLINI